MNKFESIGDYTEAMHTASLVAHRIDPKPDSRTVRAVMAAMHAMHEEMNPTLVLAQFGLDPCETAAVLDAIRLEEIDAPPTAALFTHGFLLSLHYIAALEDALSRREPELPVEPELRFQLSYLCKKLGVRVPVWEGEK